MKKSASVAAAKTPSKTKRKKSPPYLTKRILISAAKRGIRKAAEETMQIMGHVVIAQNGWVVRKYADGTIEQIEQIIP